MKRSENTHTHGGSHRLRLGLGILKALFTTPPTTPTTVTVTEDGSLSIKTHSSSGRAAHALR
jgi:hypothetical protein